MLTTKVLKQSVTIDADPARIWQVLVDPVLVKRYLFGTTMTLEPHVGGAIRFTGAWEGKSYTDKGTVTGYRPNEHFSYSYYSSFSVLPDLPENYSLISFIIEPRSSGAVLHLEQRGFADESAYAHAKENWTTMMNDMKRIAEERQ